MQKADIVPMPAPEPVKDFQINIRVTNEIGKAFYSFCDRREMKPSDLLRTIIGLYGRSEILRKKIESGGIPRDDAFVELGRIVADAKRLSQANGEFREAINKLLEPYGVKIEL